ncbi:MAG: class I SAM-dependent methyltransferase [Hyphomonadaceae bacterium]|nr:class I SAM-dependent methyltransferase [Hyphomonadaceae bacterium]
MNNSAYIPALGRREWTGMYDWVIAAMTRERVWRSPVLTALDARTGEVIVDLGAGTGSLGIMIKKHAPGARLVAVDPDPDVRLIGERKARAAGVEIDYETAMGHAHLASVEAAEADTVTCSLVRRQCPLEAKQSILENAFRLLKPGGRLVLADYGEQPTPLMRTAFLLVQMTDGFEPTEHNRRGAVPHLLQACGFQRTEIVKRVPTATGLISIWRATKEV